MDRPPQIVLQRKSRTELERLLADGDTAQTIAKRAVKIKIAEKTVKERPANASPEARVPRITAGADKAYDTKDHIESLRAIGVTPHMARNKSPTKTGKRQESYAQSQKRRKMIQCIFGWGKQHGTMRKTKHRGVACAAGGFFLNLIASNLIRIPELVSA